MWLVVTALGSTILLIPDITATTLWKATVLSALLDELNLTTARLASLPIIQYIGKEPNDKETGHEREQSSQPWPQNRLREMD
jgi:hypothetical protein